MPRMQLACRASRLGLHFTVASTMSVASYLNKGHATSGANTCCIDISKQCFDFAAAEHTAGLANCRSCLCRQLGLAAEVAEANSMAASAAAAEQQAPEEVASEHLYTCSSSVKAHPSIHTRAVQDSAEQDNDHLELLHWRQRLLELLQCPEAAGVSKPLQQQPAEQWAI